jgi:hypothetical protein
MTNWFDVPFIDYMNAVDDLLADLYGIPAEAGADPDDIAAAQEEGDTPEGFVQSIAEQYGLEKNAALLMHET